MMFFSLENLNYLKKINEKTDSSMGFKLSYLDPS